MLVVICLLLAAAIGLLILLFSKVSFSFKEFEKLERLVREETAHSREELSRNLSSSNQASFSHLAEIATLQKNQLDTFSQQLLSLTKLNEDKLEKIREAVENNLKTLRQENSEKLEKMRETVDEKLHSTLERRLGESFKLVSERLEKVHQGLGEMQTLASGVGDLKKVLANVKTRGIWGEVQLGNLLDQILTPEQYEKNVVTKKGSRDTVEFAIKMPGRDGTGIYLPIDAKFPLEDYERLIQAQEDANVQLMEEAGKAFEQRLKLEAKNIRDKYLDPPFTTDFAILFLPIEGLYAEALRRPGFGDLLQREYRVLMTGPTTFAAILNSLQMGFRTLAVEKRASEVWMLLGAVKTEFGKFGEILDKTHKKLQEASNTIEDAARKSRTIESKLRNVQGISAQEKPFLENKKNVDVSLESVNSDALLQ